jgi:Spy/CpxP family protein refolding chaperone
MNSRFAVITAMTAVLSAGALMAEQTNVTRHRQWNAQGRLDRMSAALSLTDTQKQQVKDIFMAQREKARPVRGELREERKAVRAAIQAGKPAAEIEALAKHEGPALANLSAIRAEGFAKLYSVLTPEQRQKLAGLRQEHRQEHRQGRNS